MSAFPDTPVSLLARLAAERTGQSQADWTRFFELYQPVIEKFASFAGARREAEDVAQDVFLKLVEVFRESTYDPRRGSFRAYLATMIRREVVNRLRRYQQLRLADEDPRRAHDRRARSPARRVIRRPPDRLDDPATRPPLRT